jgi:hypothetical protein
VGLQGLHGCLLTVLDELPGKGGFGIGYKDHFESGNFREGDINTVAIVASTCGSDGRASIRFYKCVFAGNVKLRQCPWFAILRTGSQGIRFLVIDESFRCGVQLQSPSNSCGDVSRMTQH